MTLTLDLPSDLENVLTTEAARLRLPVNEYAMRVLASCRLPDPKPLTGKELVDYWQSEGLIGSRSEITEPAEYARELRQQAEKRYRAGA